MYPHPMLKISLKLNRKREKELDELQAKRKRLGYPQEGIHLKAIKSGFPEKSFREGKLTKGREYIVVDNIDLIDGYFHVVSDDRGFSIRLTPEVLKEYFGVELQINPSVR